MRTIPLTQGKVALVSDCDADLASVKWYCSAAGYAMRNRPGKQGKIFLHREISARMGMSGFIDHRNRNKLDNQRPNLRAATYSQNQANVAGHRDSKSPFKGVSWYAPTGQWQADIMVRGVKQYLKRWDTPQQAARVYNEAARKHFGEFAWLNRIEERRQQVTSVIVEQRLGYDRRTAGQTRRR